MLNQGELFKLASSIVRFVPNPDIPRVNRLFDYTESQREQASRIMVHAIENTPIEDLDFYQVETLRHIYENGGGSKELRYLLHKVINKVLNT